MVARRTYRVRGLDCGEEVAILRREVGALPGVIDLEFDVVNARMGVEYDAERIEPPRIEESINSTGMTALPWEARQAAPSEPFWRRHGHTVMTAASGLLLVAGFVWHWAAHGGLWHAFAVGHTFAQFPLGAVMLYVASVAAGAWYVAPRALRAVQRLRADMNLLMFVAVVGALVLGEWFEGATVSFLFSLSLLLEGWSVERARRAIAALLDLSPRTARVRLPDGRSTEIAVEDVQVGSTVLVRPGERVPMDGVVTAGESTVNEAPITGESMPAEKAEGDEVFAGTINEVGRLELRASKPFRDTTLARIIHMVEEAQGRRAVSQQWIDRFAVVYTPAMMFLALGVALFGPLALGGEWREWIYRALVLLVIACPCALVISTPVSIVSALTAAARHGVLVKGGAYLEAAGRLRALAIDKTGTLTHGRPEVQQVTPLNGARSEELLSAAASLESHSEHPLARAVLRRAREMGIEPRPVGEFIAVRGRGVEGSIDGRRYWMGSHRYMHDKRQETAESHDRAAAMEDAGHTVVVVGDETGVRGLIGIADTMRTDVAGAIRDLRAAGVGEIVMLTGDNQGTAKAVAEAAGVDEFRCELLPEDKVEAVGALMRKHGHVGMVGDGINDAPAMAAASVGIAMGAMGTDAALETADVALMADDLGKLAWLVRHSRRTLRVIVQNVAFALAVKATFVGLTLFGFASLWGAIAADTGATLLVTFNALRLLRG